MSPALVRTRYLLPVLFLLIFFFSWYSFKIIYLPARDGDSSKFVFENFFFFNFMLKALLLLVKLVALILIIKMGAFFLKYEISTRSIVFSVVVGEFVFLIPDAIEILNFTFFNKDYTLAEYSNFTTFSVYDLIQTENNRFSYLLKSFSIFQLLYICTLALVLSRRDRARSMDDYLKLVLLFYVPPFLLYIFVVEAFNQSML